MTDFDVYYEFLEGLRESGITNMFGATPYLVAEFPELDEKSAQQILASWMKNYATLAKKFGWR